MAHLLKPDTSIAQKQAGCWVVLDGPNDVVAAANTGHAQDVTERGSVKYIYFTSRELAIKGLYKINGEASKVTRKKLSFYTNGLEDPSKYSKRQRG